MAFFEVDPFEEGVIEDAADGVGDLAVELGGIVEQVEESGQVLGAEGDLLAAVFLGGLDAFAVGGDLAQAGADLVAGEFSIGGEVEQALLLDVEGGEFLFGAGVDAPDGGLVMLDGLGDLLSHGGQEVGWQSDGRVVVLDHLFDVPGREVWQVAVAVLASATEVVGVALTAASAGLGVDEPGFSAGFNAAVAEQQAFEVVVVDAVALALAGALGEDVLDAVVELLRDECVVTSRVGLAFVDDLPGVVGVAEHGPQGVGGDRPGGPSAESPRGQTLVGHRRLEAVDGVFAGGVEAPGRADERRAFLVDGHAVDEPSVVLDADVLVAEGCPADGAAVLGLLAEFVADVGTVGLGAVLVERGEHAVHEPPFGRVIDVLGGGDEGDAPALQVGHDERVVQAVAVHAGELVDDDVGDVTLLADAPQHRLEGFAFVHFGGGPSGFDVFADDGQAKLRRLIGDGDPLGRDGDAFGVVVGVDLARAADPQVEDGVVDGLGRQLTTLAGAHVRTPVVPSVDVVNACGR